ncbi:uncharacterized protein LOC112001876 [Quercus suber]|uniref:uncharacterized protein LOC112001876 n=1 Tax=Quercus suber TaxID=58331 RepID=UPI000CE16F71|nr:uncharacterized protein LOC112001300 [Quercus suber]XP_023889808.1 uncharacterized protein LOC112001876 [Quercus suber]
MEVGYPDHRRPLYLASSINQIPIKRALVDMGAPMNLIPLSTLQAAGISERKIQGCPMEVTGFGRKGEYTAGHIQLWLKMGPIASLARFHMVKMEVSYHVLLGRPWLHKHRLVSSTYHQCLKGRMNGKMIRIAANPSPFEQVEAYLVETMFYDQWAPSGESSEKLELILLLKEYKDVFAWDYSEMPGLDPGLVVHTLNVDLEAKQVAQPTRKFHTEIEGKIVKEVEKLLAAGFIKPI